jgi:hypothetical protein
VKSKYFTLAELSPENFNGNTLLFLGPKGTDSDASLYSSCARISASLKLSQLHALAAFFSKGKLHTCYWKRRFQAHLPLKFNFSRLGEELIFVHPFSGREQYWWLHSAEKIFFFRGQIAHELLKETL